MGNKHNNKMSYFWDEEEAHDFFSAHAQSTEEYFQSLAAEKEDHSFNDRLDRALGIVE